MVSIAVCICCSRKSWCNAAMRLQSRLLCTTWCWATQNWPRSCLWAYEACCLQIGNIRECLAVEHSVLPFLGLAVCATAPFATLQYKMSSICVFGHWLNTADAALALIRCASLFCIHCVTRGQCESGCGQSIQANVLTQKAARRMQVSAKNWICHLFTAKIQLSALFRKHFFEIYKRAFGARPYRAKGVHVHAERTSRKHRLGTSTPEFPKADKLWDACLK